MNFTNLALLHTGIYLYPTCVPKPLPGQASTDVFLKTSHCFRGAPRSLVSPDCWLSPSLKELPLSGKEKDSPVTRGLQMALFCVCLCMKMTIRNQGWGNPYKNYQHCSSRGTDCAMGLIFSPGYLRAKTMWCTSVEAPAPSPPGKMS